MYALRACRCPQGTAAAVRWRRRRLDARMRGMRKHIYVLDSLATPLHYWSKALHPAVTLLLMLL